MTKNQLHEVRREKRVRQWELAAIARVHQSRLSLAENGFISLKPEEEERVAQALGEDPKNIFPEVN
ncbi:MAG: helix-turn-helix transcriptional regulator [Thermodesulfobacteriota bacterium]|jgi:transcriptional regulator with XRE-family HTH domain|nr:MAG: helix-turn-helix transcriptional regulator [Thermodesulfobacteriota bacterium]